MVQSDEGVRAQRAEAFTCRALIRELLPARRRRLVGLARPVLPEDGERGSTGADDRAVAAHR
jgi:hypothetical protein